MQPPQFLEGLIDSLRSLPRKAYFIAVPIPIFLVTVAVTLATSGGGGNETPDLALNPTVAPGIQNVDEPATATATATAQATNTPVPTVVPANREDCDAIQGTEYESPEEREWYLANCLNGSTASTDPGTRGGDAPSGGGGAPSGAPSGGGAAYAGEFALGDTLVIPSLGINATVTGATVPSSGAMPDPAGYFNAVWYDFQNFPGLGGYLDGNVVLAAHVDCAVCHNGSSGLALFYYIGSLAPGAQAQYYSHTGEVATYVVRSVNIYSPGTDWSSIVASGSADMTLITCGGTWDPVAHEYSTRTAVWLDRVS